MPKPKKKPDAERLTWEELCKLFPDDWAPCDLPDSSEANQTSTVADVSR